MRQFWYATGRKTGFTSSTVAMAWAQKKYGPLQWGNFHQGPNGSLRVVGKTENEADDRIVVEKR